MVNANTMGEFKIAINNRLFDKARAEVDLVRFLSVDHICNIALAEWLQRKAKSDEAEKRRKEKSEREHRATLAIWGEKENDKEVEEDKNIQTGQNTEEQFYIDNKGKIKPV